MGCCEGRGGAQGVFPVSTWWHIIQPTKLSLGSFLKEASPLAHPHYHLPHSFPSEVSVHPTLGHSFLSCWFRFVFPFSTLRASRGRVRVLLTFNLNDQHRLELKMYQLSEWVQPVKAQWKWCFDPLRPLSVHILRFHRSVFVLLWHELFMNLSYFIPPLDCELLVLSMSSSAIEKYFICIWIIELTDWITKYFNLPGLFFQILPRHVCMR